MQRILGRKVLLSIAIILVAAAKGHYYPHDPYAADDPNNGYPHHFCDLNDDEYGRPYLGPYDQYIREPSIFPVIPPPEDYNATPEQLPEEQSHGEPNKRQARRFVACITSNECERKESCSGSGTQYDNCGRRCTCSNGVLVNCCRVRKEWRSMTQAERCLYVNTLVTASTRRPWKGCYDQLIGLHAEYFDDGIHGGPSSFFFPWHRWYILSLENLLRQINCNVTIPYWDWSLESQIWTNSIVWNAQCGLGGEGRPVRTGPFRPSAWRAPNGRPLTRRYNGVLPDCASVAIVQRMGVPQFSSWHRFIASNLHNTFHCNMGGAMCTSQAANDPVFFLHHGFLDKLWADWQNKGVAFKNLAVYAQNTDDMPGAFGTTPKMMYDLLKQPGCVQVCIQQSDRPCCSNTTYTPICYRDMSSRDYSLIKLARLVHRPFPRVSDEAFDLFHTPREDRVIAHRFADLMNSQDKLTEALSFCGYTTEMATVYQPSSGYLNFDTYLYRPDAFDRYTNATDYPPQCLRYIYGKSYS